MAFSCVMNYEIRNAEKDSSMFCQKILPKVIPTLKNLKTQLDPEKPGLCIFCHIRSQLILTEFCLWECEKNVLAEIAAQQPLLVMHFERFEQKVNVLSKL